MINTSTNPKTQQHFERDRDGQYVLFPRSDGLNASHIVDVTNQPYVFVASGLPLNVAAKFQISSDRVGWTDWKIHGEQVELSEDHPLQWINIAGQVRLALYDRVTCTPYIGVVQPSITCYPSTTTHERSWSLVNPNGECMSCKTLTAPELVAAFASLTPQQASLICSVLACPNTSLVAPVPNGNTNPTTAPASGTSPFFLNTSTPTPVLYVWNGTSYVPATAFTSLVQAVSGGVVPVATDTVQGRVALNLGTQVGDSTNGLDALTAAGLITLLAAPNPLQAAIASTAAAVPVATDTVQGRVALNTGSTAGDATNTVDALTAAGLTTLLTGPASPLNSAVAALGGGGGGGGSPTGVAGGGLSGTYPNPTVNLAAIPANGITPAQVADLDPVGNVTVSSNVSGLIPAFAPGEWRIGSGVTLQPGLYIVAWSALIEFDVVATGAAVVGFNLLTSDAAVGNLTGKAVHSGLGGYIDWDSVGASGTLHIASGFIKVTSPVTLTLAVAHAAIHGSGAAISNVSINSAAPLQLNVVKL